MDSDATRGSDYRLARMNSGRIDKHGILRDEQESFRRDVAYIGLVLKIGIEELGTLNQENPVEFIL